MVSSDAEQALLGLVAKDDFFDNERNLVRVFNFDYDKIISFKKKVFMSQSCYGVILFLFLFSWTVRSLFERPAPGKPEPSIPPSLLPVVVTVVLFWQTWTRWKNIEWVVRCQHICLTIDGVKYVTAKHPSGMGLSCWDKGQVSKTVAYDKITDCDVELPAGTVGCCISDVITKVHLDTASTFKGHELSLIGLCDPEEFKHAVWENKRKNQGMPAMAQQPAAPQPAAHDGLQVALLQEMVGQQKEIVEQLRQLNAK